jgi:hypothetical protein|tara:strand:+ start:261 stop:485 length:225 start_codon:yes stop_codon:yes gene_type:complete
MPVKLKKKTKKMSAVDNKEYRSLGKSGARKMSGGQAQGYTRGGAQLVGMIPRRPKSKHRKGIGSTGSKYQPKKG